MKTIKLRAVEPEDVDFMLECESDQESLKWSDYRAPLSRNQLLTYALTYDADPFSACQLRLIAETEDGERVGIVDLYEISEKDEKAFVGICIHPDLRSKGMGAKVLSSLSELARDTIGLHLLVSKVSTQNPIAAKLFKKAGYIQTAILPHWHKIGSRHHDFFLFTKILCPLK